MDQDLSVGNIYIFMENEAREKMKSMFLFVLPASFLKMHGFFFIICSGRHNSSWKICFNFMQMTQLLLLCFRLLQMPEKSVEKTGKKFRLTSFYHLFIRLQIKKVYNQ